MNPNYSARQLVVDGIEVVQLADSARQTEVSIASAIGNMAYEWKVRGKNFLWFPYSSPAELRQQPRLCGVPFLAPWANRLDGDGFWANGKRYLLNAGMGNLRRDGNQKPIHGLLNFSPSWNLLEAGADQHSAWSASRIEFWKHPEMMAQFPFAHTITITYRVRDGVVEVETALENHAAAPMPVAVGFHPYFRLHDTPRDQWKVHLAARDRLVLDQTLIPTGERKPVESGGEYSLRAGQLDDVFANLIRGEDGHANFFVEGGPERVTVSYGPKYTVAVVYAPRDKEFICFEPMSAVTNAFNLAHAGLYQELQSVPAGGSWKESFWLSAK